MTKSRTNYWESTECDKIRSITIWEVSEDVNENGFINTKNPSASPPESSKTISPQFKPPWLAAGILELTKWVDGETLQDLDRNSKEESKGVWEDGRDMAAVMAEIWVERQKKVRKERKDRKLMNGLSVGLGFGEIYGEMLLLLICVSVVCLFCVTFYFYF